MSDICSVWSKVTIGVEKFQVDVKKRRWGRPKLPMDVKWGRNEYIWN